MLDLDKSKGPRPRCLVTHTTLPKYLDHDQPPRKKRPFSTILTSPFAHNLSILLPSPASQKLTTTLQTHPPLHYSKVHLKLLDLITGPFFTTHIKTPGPPAKDIFMLSRGRPGVDALYTLSHGVLHLEVPQHLYERLGLPGKPLLPGHTLGRKHVKSRYAVEVNLRLPQMVRGKAGFERVVRAFREVLDESVTWLVYCAEEVEALFAEHQPVVREVVEMVTRLEGANVPSFLRGEERGGEAEAEMLEWVTMAMMGSEGVCEYARPDVQISRYRVPGSGGDEGGTTTRRQDLMTFTWNGLIPPDFAHKLFLAAMKASGDEWIAMTASMFSGEAYTILVHQGEALTWEYKD